MVKVIMLLRRNPKLTHEEFVKHWHEVHATKVQSVPEFTRHMRKYVQNHFVTDEAASKMTAQQGVNGMDFDGIVEIYYDSLGEMLKSFKLQGYKDIIAPDELHLVDIPNSVMYLADEKVIFDEENRPAAETASG